MLIAGSVEGLLYTHTSLCDKRCRYSSNRKSNMKGKCEKDKDFLAGRNALDGLYIWRGWCSLLFLRIALLGSSWGSDTINMSVRMLRLLMLQWPVNFSQEILSREIRVIGKETIDSMVMFVGTLHSPASSLLYLVLCLWAESHWNYVGPDCGYLYSLRYFLVIL